LLKLYPEIVTGLLVATFASAKTPNGDPVTRLTVSAEYNLPSLALLAPEVNTGVPDKVVLLEPL
jgi:hypothetical protein